MVCKWGNVYARAKPDSPLFKSNAQLSIMCKHVYPMKALS